MNPLLNKGKITAIHNLAPPKVRHQTTERSLLGKITYLLKRLFKVAISFCKMATLGLNRLVLDNQRSPPYRPRIHHPDQD